MAGGDSLRDDCHLKAEGATRQVCGETKKMKEKKGRNREISSLSLFFSFFPYSNSTPPNPRKREKDKVSIRLEYLVVARPKGGLAFGKSRKNQKFFPPSSWERWEHLSQEEGGKTFVEKKEQKCWIYIDGWGFKTVRGRG
jgi:hypothetical protein